MGRPAGRDGSNEVVLNYPQVTFRIKPEVKFRCEQSYRFLGFKSNTALVEEAVKDYLNRELTLAHKRLIYSAAKRLHERWMLASEVKARIKREKLKEDIREDLLEAERKVIERFTPSL